MVNVNPQIRLSIAQNNDWGVCFAAIEFWVMDRTPFGDEI